EIAYVQRVQADEGAVRWSVPTLVAPRYIPGAPSGDRTAHGAADPTDRVPDADRISPPIDPSRALYGLSLDLVFDMGADVVVECPSHKVVVTHEGAIARVRFAQREVTLDRDVVVTARGKANAPLASCLTHKTEKGGFVALTVVPD